MSKDEEEDGEYSGLHQQGFPLFASALKMMTIFVGCSAVNTFQDNTLNSAFLAMLS